MFTGLIEHRCTLLRSTDTPTGKRLTLSNPWPDLVHGESISINGCCLTVASFDSTTVSFDVIPQSLSLTSLGDLRLGQTVHAERALRVGDRLGGHMVQGHVDGVGEVLSNAGTPAGWRLRIRPPESLLKYCVPQGSITLDGVSLTLADRDDDFLEVALIPTTLTLTELGKLSPGDRVNIEVDLITKTIVQTLARQQSLTGVLL